MCNLFMTLASRWVWLAGQGVSTFFGTPSSSTSFIKEDWDVSIVYCIPYCVFNIHIGWVFSLHKFGQVVLAGVAIAWFDLLLFNNGGLMLVSKFSIFSVLYIRRLINGLLFWHYYLLWRQQKVGITVHVESMIETIQIGSEVWQLAWASGNWQGIPGQTSVLVHLAGGWATWLMIVYVHQSQ